MSEEKCCGGGCREDSYGFVKAMSGLVEAMSDSDIVRSDLVEEQCFIDSFNTLSKRFNETATTHGFWEGPQNDAEKIALMHSELSEALEAIRHGDPKDDKINFSGTTAELADCIIRIMDYAYENELPLAEAIIAKNKYNQTRPYKHGKKF